MSERPDSGEGAILDRNPVVLVVDDEEDLADLYSQWLTDDYAVRTAYHGEQALERLDETVDVVLLDRRMPDLSGDDVLNRIREREYDCRVAMVTAVEPEFDIIELGFDEYLVKPVSGPELYEVIEDLLTRATHDDIMQEYYAGVAKRAALDAEKSDSELANNERYAALIATIEDIESELEEVQGAFESDDFEAAFRDLGGPDDE